MMIESLAFKLIAASALCIAVLLPFYYLLGYSVLSFVSSVWHYRSKHSWEFTFEDVPIAALALLSSIVVGCKVAGVFPQIELIWQLSTIAFIICLSLSLCLAKIGRIKPQLPLPSWKPSLIWVILFVIYLGRSLIKARSLESAQYLPSRFNTDIFLYIRRSIVFLSQAERSHTENGDRLLDILYNSPKLLSTLVYTTFTKISGDIGIAASIVTSIVLAAIVLKYLLLLGKYSSGITWVNCGLAGLIIFQPVWCWLQDQFYWSNLLCIYLLVYLLQNLVDSSSIERTWLIRYTLALIALAGFYPSQIPFFCLATGIGISFQADLAAKTRHRYLIASLGIAIAILCLFSTQYFDTSEVVKHFDLTDAKHGQNLNYIPFWAWWYFEPRTGGTPKDLGAVLLIAGSLLLAAIAIRYCWQTLPRRSNWFKLLLILYLLYSLSYLLLPGEYRQSKFFFTYIVPLIVFCAIEWVGQTRLKRQRIFRLLVPALAVYVAIKSFDKPYKPHVAGEISQVIANLKPNQPLTIYTDDGSIAHGYYYFAYRLRHQDFELFTGCPASEDLQSLDRRRQAIVAKSCPQIEIPADLEDKIIYPNINGADE